MLLLTVDSVCQ